MDVAVPVVRLADGPGEPRAGIAADLGAGLSHQDLALADLGLHDVAAPAQERDQPLRISVLRAPDVDREPRRSFGGLLLRLADRPTLAQLAGLARFAVWAGRLRPGLAARLLRRRRREI